MSARAPRAAALEALLLFLGCQAIDPPSGLVFPCEVSADCPAWAQSCVDGLCVEPSVAPQLAPDASAAPDVPAAPRPDGGTLVSLLDAGWLVALPDGGGTVADAGVVPPSVTPTPGDRPPVAPPSAPLAESACGDGRDDDGDGRADCADADCEGRSCGAAASARCCAGRCVETARDLEHCGGCGARCAAGRVCMTVPAPGGSTGACSCLGGGCPLGQRCGLNGVCGCDGDERCAAGQRCAPTTLAGVCVARSP